MLVGVTVIRTHGIARRYSTRQGERHMNLITRICAFGRDESGQDLLEYALLTALIALAATVAIKAAGVQVTSIFTSITAAMANAAPA
jgi:Flp pilus assembly pilin Flp